MIYTELTAKAMKISFLAHKEQTDKSGIPYIFHPFHIAEQMNDEYSVCTALLHDVVEDTEITIEELENDFPSEITEAIKLLTHDKNENYFDYILRIKSNETAKAVKLADLRHNSDLSRLSSVGITPSEKDIERREKYLKAISILLDYSSE